MQDLFFLAGWVEMGQFEYLMFSFLSPKKAYISKHVNIAERQKKPIIYLNSHGYYVVYCLYCLNTS